MPVILAALVGLAVVAIGLYWFMRANPSALARRLPSDMAVYAVSPGAATSTKVSRQASLAVKYLFIPIANLIPGMNQTPETAAGRYLQASKFGTDVSGQFFASAEGKFSGPIEAQLQPHLHDGAFQEAAWQAVVNVSGVNLPVVDLH